MISKPAPDSDYSVSARCPEIGEWGGIPTLRTLVRYVFSEAWVFRHTASNTGESRDMVSNPLDPDLMTAPERLTEVGSLPARGILRYGLRQRTRESLP